MLDNGSNGNTGPGVDAVDADTLRRALALVRAVRDPALPGLLVLFGLMLLGFAAVALGWRGAAGTYFVPVQTPHLVSGGFTGVALVGVGAALVAIQSERRDRAIARREMGQLVGEVSGLARTAIARRSGTIGKVGER